MAGLFGVMRSSAEAMDAIRKALDVTQTNVANASTPGYARQRIRLEALPFDPGAGRCGGVRAVTVEGSRSEYAEGAVRERQQAYGYADQRARQAAAVEPAFDVSGEAGVPGALNALFQSLSALSVDPEAASARQAFLTSADAAARRIRALAGTLEKAEASAEAETRSVVAGINELAARIRDHNSLARPDAAADAAAYSALEELATLADFTLLTQEDGSFTVLLGGQIPLVTGDEAYELTVETSADGMALRDVAGRDVTGQITDGRLGALLGYRNTTVPGWTDSLDDLAAELGARVNAAAGTEVFTSNPAAPAASLGVNPSATLGPLDPATLAASSQAASLTFTALYASIAGAVGREAQSAGEECYMTEALLNQAQQMRSDVSGVSLDEEAENLLEWQRSYQAVASVVRIVDEMTRQTLALAG